MASKYERARQVARRHQELGMAVPSWARHQFGQNAVEGNPQFPSSTCIHSFQYEQDSGRLNLVFTGGNGGHYDGVPAELARRLALAPSKGKFYNRAIKGRFPYTRD